MNYKDNFRLEVKAMNNQELKETFNDFSEHKELFSHLNIIELEFKNRNLI